MKPFIFSAIFLIFLEIPAIYGQSCKIKPYKILPGHQYKVMNLDFSADGKYLASCGWDNMVRLWNMESYTQIREFNGHADVIWQIEISRDNKYIISGSRDVSFVIWDFQSGEIIKKISVTPGKVPMYPDYPGVEQNWPNSINAVCFSNDTKLIAVSSSDYLIRIYQLDSLKLLHTLKGHNGLVLNIVFSADNNFMVSGAIGKEIIIWETATFSPVRILKEEKNAYNGSFQLIQNDKYLINTGDCKINIWDVSSGIKVRSIPVQCALQSVRLTPDEKYMATCGEDYTARLYDFKTGKEIWCYRNPKPEIADCKISPNGRYLTVATPEGKILIWEIEEIIKNE